MFKAFNFIARALVAFIKLISFIDRRIHLQKKIRKSSTGQFGKCWGEETGIKLIMIIEIVEFLFLAVD